MKPAARYLEREPTRDEIEVLRAKAAVCDAYRAWLRDTSQRNCRRVGELLIELAQLEARLEEEARCRLRLPH